MKIYLTRCIVILFFSCFLTFCYASTQFEVGITCDSDVYYTGETGKVSISVANNGQNALVNIYIIYVNPAGGFSYYTTSNNGEWVPRFNNTKREVMIHSGFNLPMVEVADIYFKESHDISQPPSFGQYTLYFALVDYETNQVISNIASKTFDYQGVPDKGNWTGYFHREIRYLAIEGDKLWAAGVGLTSINMITDEKQYYTKDNGLVINSISDFAAGSNSMKWLATQNDGLMSFDGTSWNYYNQTTGDIVDNNYNIIAVDHDNKLWSSQTGMIWVFDGENWTSFYNKNMSSVRYIGFDPEGNAWFGTFDDGVFKYDGYSWVNYTSTNSGLISDYVIAIAYDGEGNVWFGSCDKGVSMFDGDEWISYDTENSELVDDNISCIFIDSRGTKWIGTRYSGVSMFDDRKWTTYNTENSSLKNNNISDITEYTDGRMFFAADGLAFFDGENWDEISLDNNGLLDNKCKLIAIDSLERKWIGNDTGMVMYDGESWTHYTESNSDLVSNDVYEIAIDSEDNLWIGTKYQGLSFFDGTSWTTYDFAIEDYKYSNRIYSIAFDKNDEVWISTGTPALYHLNNGTWDRIDTFTKVLENITTYSIAFDLENIMWLGTDDGAFSYDGSIWTHIEQTSNGLASDDIRVVAVDSQNRKWFGSQDAVVCVFDGDTWLSYDYTNSTIFKKSAINDIKFDDDNKVYICNEGLTVFDGTSWITYDKYNSGLLNEVSSIAIDSDGKKWIASSGGGICSYKEN